MFKKYTKKSEQGSKKGKKIVIHHLPITLPASLGIARKMRGEEKEKKEVAVPIQETGAKLRKDYHIAERPVVNKDIFVNKDSSAFGKVFPLYKNNNPVPRRTNSRGQWNGIL